MKPFNFAGYFLIIFSLWSAGELHAQKLHVPSVNRQGITTASQIENALLQPVNKHPHRIGTVRHKMPRLPVVLSVGNPAVKTPVLRSEHTAVHGGRTTIELQFDLGEPRLGKSNEKVIGAGNTEFHSAQWYNLDLNNLPEGCQIGYSEIKGEEEHPTLECIIAIPEAASNIHASIADDQSRIFKDALLIPTVVSLHDSVRGRLYSSAGYSRVNSDKPVLTAPKTFRTLRSIRVSIPLAVRQSAHTLQLRRSFKVTIDLNAPPQENLSLNTDTWFRDAERRMVVNPNDLSAFAAPFQRSIASRMLQNAAAMRTQIAAATPTDWIDPNAAYIKLSIVRDGLYRVSAQDIKELSRTGSIPGFDLTAAGWRPGNIRMFNRGVEIPIWVDTLPSGEIDAVEFYGVHLPGFPGEYYNVSTDTNCYWLTVSNKFPNPPLRIKPLQVTARPAETMSDGNISLHHERDFFLYDGDRFGQDYLTVQRTPWDIPGRRFVWGLLQPATTDTSRKPPVDTSRIRDTFYVAGLSPKPVRFNFFVRGASNSPIHHCKIFLNGRTIADRSFTAFDSVALTSIVPPDQILEGRNTIEVQSARDTSNGGYDQFYLDYYNVSFAAQNAPSVDTGVAFGQLHFSITPNGTTYGVGIAATNEIVYNLTDGTRLLSAVPNGNTATYYDSTVSSQSEYVAASSSSFLHPPRIYQWNVSGVPGWGILSRTNGADYIILTHPNFRQAADRLHVHRSGTMRTLTVTTDEVFNAFGYGSNEPEAIRSFLTYAYHNYQGTPVGFVTLLGDASWDAKLNLNNPFHPDDKSTILSYVPSFGLVVSDFYFTLTDTGSLDRQDPQMVISRVPVDTLSEANAFVDKLVEYESAAPADWNRKFLFILGGGSPDEHGFFVNQVNQILDDKGIAGIRNPPTNVQPQIIEERIFGGTDLTHTDSIRTAVKQGQSIMYFDGHGATFITDVFLGDPTTYLNKGLYPVLITLSCRTGAFAEPNSVTLNEAFLETANGGMIMAFGTTGFGEIGYDFNLSARFFSLMKSYRSTHDTTRPEAVNLAQLFTLAKLFASNGSGDIGINSRLQYSILGDAPMGFVFRPQPEFAVHPTDIQTLTSAGNAQNIFALSDTSFEVRATIHNYGYSISRPVLIRFTDRGPNGLTLTKVDTLHVLDTLAAINESFPITGQSAGQHTIEVFADYDNKFPEFNENDNGASIAILVNGLSATPFYPPEGARSFCDADRNGVNFIVLLPTGAPNTQNEVQIDVDTSRQFAHPVRFDTIVRNTYYVEHLVGATLPHPTSNVLWWRSRTLQNGLDTAWQYASFSLDHSSPSEFSYSTSEQLSETVLAGLSINTSGNIFLPSTDTAVYDVIAHGAFDKSSNLLPHSVILLNGNSIFSIQAGPNSPGIAIAILNADEGSIDTVFEFARKGNDSTLQRDQLREVAQFDSIIRLIPQGRKVIVLTNFDPFLPYFTHDTSVTAALKSLGSLNGFGQLYYRGSYILIGEKGFAPGKAKEQIAGEGGNGAEIQDTIVTRGTSGTGETPFSAVANRYGNFRWSGPALPNGTDIQFQVLGSRRDGSGVARVASFNGSSARTFDLSHIDARVYDRIKVAFTFTRTVVAVASPELSALEFEYSPAPEVAIDFDTVLTNPQTIKEGGLVIASYVVRNLTCIPAINFLTMLTRTVLGRTDTISNFVIPTLAGHASFTVIDSIATNTSNGRIALNATVNPNEAQNEQLLFNDIGSGSFLVVRDTAKPRTEILVDNHHIANYDFVSKNSSITVNLYQTTFLRVTDSNAVSAVLTNDADPGTPIYLLAGAGSSPKFKVSFIRLPSGLLQAQLIATPLTPLAPGRYTVTAYDHDASGNTDTVSQSFTISDVNGIEHVLNYPNPFKDKTQITFVVKSDGASDATVLIYTVAGRKIRTLKPSSIRVGLNVIDWDARDEAGNDVANGTYLFRVVMNGSNPDGSASNNGTTERMVRSR